MSTERHTGQNLLHQRPWRYLRFSLRSLLVLMTALSLWLGWQVYRAREQRDALEYLRRVPVGSISFDRRKEDLWAPAWLRNSVGDDFFQSVIEVHLTQNVNNQNLPAIVDQLDRLPNLRDVYLWHARVTDDDLRHLVPLTQITKLGLHFPHESVTGRGLQHVVYLQNIRELWLSGSSMTNDALDFVPKFRQLESLELGLFEVSDDGFRRVSECARLKRLSLRNCYCSHVGLNIIASIPSLEVLSFWNMDFPEPLKSHSSGSDPAWRLVPTGGTMTQDIIDGGLMRRFERLKNWLRRMRPNLEVNSGFHT